MPTLSPRIDSLNAHNNLIINGNFDFHQRYGNTALNITDSLLYSADRFAHQKSTAYTGTSTAQRSTDVPTVAQSGFQSTYSHLITNGNSIVSPGAGDFYAGLVHFLEGYDYAQLHTKPARLQFWVKSSVTGTFTVSLRNASANRSYLATYTISSANTWEKKSIDLTFDSAGTWLFDNGRGLIIQWTLSAGSSLQDVANTWVAGNKTFATGSTNWAASAGATFRIAQIMLVEGSFSSSIDLPFKRAGKTIGDELQLCQRYYYQFSDLSSGTRPIARTIWYEANALYFTIRVPVTMRGDPTLVGTVGTDIVIYSTTLVLQSGFGITVTSNPTKDNVYISASKSGHGLTDGVLAVTSTTSGLSAEL